MQIKTLANKVLKAVPGTELANSEDADARSYHVSFAKLTNAGFRTRHNVEYGIREVIDMIKNGEVDNFRDMNYYNIKRMLSYLNIK